MDINGLITELLKQNRFITPFEARSMCQGYLVPKE